MDFHLLKIGEFYEIPENVRKRRYSEVLRPSVRRTSGLLQEILPHKIGGMFSIPGKDRQTFRRADHVYRLWSEVEESRKRQKTLQEQRDEKRALINEEMELLRERLQDSNLFYDFRDFVKVENPSCYDPETWKPENHKFQVTIPANVLMRIIGKMED